jgi:hypothetical protein
MSLSGRRFERAGSLQLRIRPEPKLLVLGVAVGEEVAEFFLLGL